MPRRRGIGLDFVDALPAEGERKLMLAVLIDAVRVTRALQMEEDQTKQLPLLKRRQLLREYAWFRSEERNHPFSFLAICEALGLDPDYIRRCVFRFRKTDMWFPVRRYASRVEESWLRQRKHGGRITLLERRSRTRGGQGATTRGTRTGPRSPRHREFTLPHFLGNAAPDLLTTENVSAQP